jgi:uncharacterized protein (UPF0335 family)
MTDAQGIARLQLKTIVERVERLEAEIADLNADKSDIYKDARGNGFDVKAIKKVVSRRKLDDNKRVEEDVVFETYWDAVHGTGLVHAHPRENIEEFDPITGEFVDTPVNPKLIKQVVDGMQTEAGRAALTAAVDIMIEREEAEEFQAKASGDNGATVQAEKVPADSVTGAASRSSRGDESPATISPSDDDAIAAVKGKARLANIADVEPSSSAPKSSVLWNEWQAAETDPTEDRSEGQSPAAESVGANAGGDHVTAQSSTAATAGALVQVAPATNRLRPLCRTPGDNCGGYGSTHCGSCLRAAREAEVAA